MEGYSVGVLKGISVVADRIKPGLKKEQSQFYYMDILRMLVMTDFRV